MKTWLRSVLAIGALSLPLIGCGAHGGAQGTEPASQAAAGKGHHFDKGTAVAVDAKFSRWLLSPRGEISGMLLEDGALVMIPPHAAKELKPAALAKGDAVHVEGFTKEGSGVYAFASVKKGDQVVIAAPQKPDGEKGGFRKHEGGRKHDGEGRKHEGKNLEGLADVSATGKVLAVLPGRHGNARGYVLEDGTVAYVHAKGQDLGVKKGDAITVTGKGGNYELGTSLVVKKITLANGETKEL
jgi:hypothetical protein